MNVSARDRKILMVLVPFAVVLGYWFLLLSPQRQEAADAAQTLATEQGRLLEAQTRASTVRAAKTTFARDYATVVALGKAIPTSVDMPSLLVQLEQAARGTGIELAGVTAGERTPAPEVTASVTPSTPSAPDPGQALQSGAGQAVATAQQTADNASAQAQPTAGTPPSGAAAAPTDPAAGGTAGAAPPASALESISLEFDFTGDFFELANFFHRLKRFVFVDGDRVRVRGRLMTIDSVEYSTDPDTFPALSATVQASVFLTPKAVGTTAGATPTGPQAAASAPAPTSTASSDSASPTPTATATP